MKILIAALAAAALALLPFASQETQNVAASGELGWCSDQVTPAGPGPCT
ncbi:hypothetical protein SK803_20435 [Lentzea sp. BCCO 10_0856]|uniref:Uncharacterized protein n=1 Tax=Lentzea miocenica TaxID=3095431 RepID=A0ABU4T3E2_9PSEU|nr:hypothetical protein [Lentzea sp. BCCO 10_0856]MDX8032589.1 hypothetical protein [Lentzea sp. BCCO 10_0856]